MRIRGVIEGFYGPPWSHEQRSTWIDRLGGWGMTHYVWAAKQEPRHRGPGWADPFTADELHQFTDLAHEHPRVSLGIGLTPGRDAHADDLVAKLAPAVAAGATVVVLSCDDLPALDAGPTHRQMANTLRSELGSEVWIVPTHYAGVDGSPYLDQLCDGLDPSIELMWTGRHVVNDTITATDARRRHAVTGRPPLLWDNTPVNDVIMDEALHLSPLAERDPELRSVCSGVLWNPMEHPLASIPTLASAAAWACGDDPLAAWHQHVGDGPLARFAEATAFRGDPHWPGEAPSDDWWRQVAALPADPATLGLDAGTQKWLDAVREGAAIALDALDAAEQRRAGVSSTALTLTEFGVATRWRAWSRRPVLTFGGGPRLRPVATQDALGHFVGGDRSLTFGPGLVELVIRATVGARA